MILENSALNELIIDNQSVNNQSANNQSVNNESLKDRIGKNTINLTNYNKHDQQSSGRVTGKALLGNKCVNLSIIDIDINKELDNETKDSIRKRILNTLSNDDIIVQTASGGLHIYSNTDEFYTTSNRMVKCYKSNDYDIDIFSCYDSYKRSLIVLPGSKVRKDHKSPINTYKFIRNDENTVINRSVNDVLNDLNVKITIPQRNDVQQIIDLNNNSDNITIDFARILIYGFEDVEIHNDSGNQPIKEEITLFTLFQAINSLPNDVINDAYDYIFENSNLTPNAKSNYNNARKRYMHLKTNPYVLINMLKYHNNEYYNKFIKKDLTENEIKISNIDLNDNFSMRDIRNKAEKHLYKTYKDVVEDLSKVIRFVESNNLMFIIKMYDTKNNKYVIGYMTNTNMKESLKMIKLWKDDKKQITVYDAFINYQSRLSVKGVKFYSTNDKDIFSIFNGYKYNTVENINENIISNFLNLVSEVIADNNEEIYNYLLNWISYIIQNPGKKTETAIVLKGLQGIGKNTFTDILCELLSGYSENNINQIGELTGNFNSVVESKMLLILNELKNAGEDRLANFDTLKSIVTDKTIRINEKNQPRRTSENVSNLIFVTNNSYPVKIESGDRRYVVLACNGKYKNNHEYWNNIYNNLNEEFYNNLLTYFIKRDINNFNPRIIPMTEAKQDLIEASRNPVDIWICNNYNNLCEGMLCADAILLKPYDIKERTFTLYLKDKCIRKQLRRDGKKPYYYFLRDECKEIYQQTINDEENNEED